MIAESINFVERKLESILREAGKIEDENPRTLVLEKYLRLCQLLVDIINSVQNSLLRRF